MNRAPRQANLCLLGAVGERQRRNDASSGDQPPCDGANTAVDRNGGSGARSRDPTATPKDQGTERIPWSHVH
jgi:hypothetical protein